jgi:hypothetical protein
MCKTSYRTNLWQKNESLLGYNDVLITYDSHQHLKCRKVQFMTEKSDANVQGIEPPILLPVVIIFMFEHGAIFKRWYTRTRCVPSCSYL